MPEQAPRARGNRLDVFTVQESRRIAQIDIEPVWKLYLEDLEQIYYALYDAARRTFSADLVGEEPEFVLGPEQIMFRSPSYSVPFHELAGLTDRSLPDLTIVSTAPAYKIVSKPWGVRIVEHEDNDILKALDRRVVEIIENRRGWVTRFFFSREIVPPIIIALAGLLGVVALELLDMRWLTGWPVIVTLLALIVVTTRKVGPVPFRAGPGVFRPNPEREEPSFFKSDFGIIIIAFMSAVLGAVATMLVGGLSGFFVP